VHLILLLLLLRQFENQHWQLQLHQLLLLAGMSRSSNVVVTAAAAARGQQLHLNKTGGALVMIVLAQILGLSARMLLLHALRLPLPALLHAKRLPLPASRMVLLLLLQLTAGVLVDLGPLQILHPLPRLPLGGGAEATCNGTCSASWFFFCLLQVRELLTQCPPLISMSMFT
jgi:hypothetical protein